MLTVTGRISKARACRNGQERIVDMKTVFPVIASRCLFPLYLGHRVQKPTHQCWHPFRQLDCLSINIVFSQPSRSARAFFNSKGRQKKFESPQPRKEKERLKTPNIAFAAITPLISRPRVDLIHASFFVCVECP